MRVGLGVGGSCGGGGGVVRFGAVGVRVRSGFGGMGGGTAAVAGGSGLHG
jgi:hypothetical protein